LRPIGEPGGLHRPGLAIGATGETGNHCFGEAGAVSPCARSAGAKGVEREAIPNDPIAYDAGKGLDAAAKPARGVRLRAPGGRARCSARPRTARRRPPARSPPPNWSPTSVARWKRRYLTG